MNSYLQRCFTDRVITEWQKLDQNFVLLFYLASNRSRDYDILKKILFEFLAIFVLYLFQGIWARKKICLRDSKKIRGKDKSQDKSWCSHRFWYKHYQRSSIYDGIQKIDWCFDSAFQKDITVSRNFMANKKKIVFFSFWLSKLIYFCFQQQLIISCFYHFAFSDKHSFLNFYHANDCSHFDTRWMMKATNLQSYNKVMKQNFSFTLLMVSPSITKTRKMKLITIWKKNKMCLFDDYKSFVKNHSPLFLSKEMR